MSSSWFSMDKLTELKGQVESAAGKAANAAQAATSALPIDEDLIKKLTLNTDELRSEREQINAEEQRREDVKNNLAALLPWETRDEEREILCEECKEAILGLSSEEDTFRAPYALPGQSNTDVAAQDGPTESKEAEGGEKQQDAEVAAAGSGDETKSADEKAADEAVKAAEVEAKKAKLEPLPPLLADFDLDAHVGLIQRLLEVDPKLVEMHANLSGAGEREKNFWKNYFFHCAFTRYEAGLSVDEIWGDNPVAPGEASPFGGGSSTGGGEDSSTSGGVGEETVTFEPEMPTPQPEVIADAPLHVEASPAGANPAAVGGTAVAAMAAAPASAGGAPATSASTASGTPVPISSQLSSSDYEVISGAAGEENDGDDDLDDLEAEIARELEEEG